MRNLRLLFLPMLFLSLAFPSFSQIDSIVGGAGILAMSTDGDPNNVPSLAVQDWTKGESIFAVDPSNGDIWIYNDSNPANAKWEIDEITTSVSYDASTNTLSINGVAESIPIADGTNAGLLGGVIDTDGGVDVSLDSEGKISTDLDVNELADGSSVDIVTDKLILYDDDTGGEVKVSVSDVQDGFEANTDDQALTMPAGSSVLELESGGTVDISTRLVYYLDDAAAAAGGVPLNHEYKLEGGNQYGLPKGMNRVRVD